MCVQFHQSYWLTSSAVRKIATFFVICASGYQLHFSRSETMLSDFFVRCASLNFSCVKVSHGRRVCNCRLGNLLPNNVASLSINDSLHSTVTNIII